MLKKFLIGIVILFIAGAAFMIFGMRMAADEFVKENEPMLRQYIQLDEAAQNKFVMEHADELLKDVMNDEIKPEDKADMELFQAAQKYPEVQAALLNFGRSFFAKALLHSDAIVKDLSADAKAKYQVESDKFTDNLQAYSDIVEKVGEKIKAAK